MRHRFSRHWRATLAALFVPAGAILALAIGTGPGTAAATAAGSLGATGSTGASTTTTTTTTTTTSSTSGAPTTPVTVCTGYLSPATATLLDPNYLNYSFHCDGNVTAFTVIVNRHGQPYSEVDDFSQNATVTSPGTKVLASVSFSCQGAVPGGGVNCFAGSGNSAAPQTGIEGQLDTSTPFCPTLPKHPKPGTKPSEGAQGELVVTDGTGNESGPWIFKMTPACPVVKAVPKQAKQHHGK